MGMETDTTHGSFRSYIVGKSAGNVPKSSEILREPHGSTYGCRDVMEGLAASRKLGLAARPSMTGSHRIYNAFGKFFQEFNSDMYDQNLPLVYVYPGIPFPYQYPARYIQLAS
jgi:hypothetical protein